MSAVYASTTFEWFAGLKAINPTEPVAFWQPTPAKPNQIKNGERWYFKQLGRPVILGYGLYAGWERLTVDQLFQRYGRRAGYPTASDLLVALKAFRPEVGSGAAVGNVVLSGFTAFDRPLPLSAVGLTDLSVRFNYIRGADPVGEYLALDRAPTTMGRNGPGGFSEPEHGAEKPTTGPTPSSWTATVTNSSEDHAATYAIRFGNHPIWKVGWAKDVQKRLRSINAHIPSEVVSDQWRLVYTHDWPSARKAHEMEQAVLRMMKPLRTKGERLRCTEDQLLTSWREAVIRLR